MARANIIPQMGFSPLNARDSDFIPVDVASTYATALYPGDPVLVVTDGTVARTPAGTNQAAATDGISAVVMQVLQYQDSGGILRTSGIPYLPASTTWTAHARRSRLLVCPVTEDIRFRVRGLTGVASLAAARAVRYKNCEHSFGTAVPGLGLGAARLVIAGNATTALQWRVEDFVDGDDPTAADASWIVTCNKIFGWPIVGQSTTGV